MNAINPNRAFRVQVRSLGEYRTVVSRALSWGFDWVVEPQDNDVPYAVLFYPDASGDRILRRQIDKYDPSARTLAYTSVRAFSFRYFIASNLRYKSRQKRSYESYPIRGVDDNNNEHSFDSCLLAVEYLRENGHPNADRHGIYQALPRFGRASAYGMRWERIFSEVK